MALHSYSIVTKSVNRKKLRLSQKMVNKKIGTKVFLKGTRGV